IPAALADGALPPVAGARRRKGGGRPAIVPVGSAHPVGRFVFSGGGGLGGPGSICGVVGGGVGDIRYGHSAPGEPYVQYGAAGRSAHGGCERGAGSELRHGKGRPVVRRGRGSAERAAQRARYPEYLQGIYGPGRGIAGILDAGGGSSAGRELSVFD